MAELSFSGLDELILSMQEVAEIPDNVQDEMLVIYIYPQGTRVRGKGENGKPVRVRNAEIAFINEYGTRRQAARPFVLQGNETSAEETTQAQATVYYRWLETKGL